MQIRVSNDLSDLASDMRTVTTSAPRAMIKTVRDAARVGNSLAKASAKKSAGSHGKHYPNAFSSEMTAQFVGLGLYAAEYGPDASKPQGRMSFERGSRNQPPHLDLARSADVVGHALAGEALDAVDSLFWPI